MDRSGTGAAASLALAAFFGCAGPTAPDLLIEPIQIEAVDVEVTDSLAPVVTVQVRGVVGDGCSTVHSVRQERSGSTVTVTILRQRPRDAICTQVARLYDARIVLEGQFAPGQYVLRVNDFERTFTVPGAPPAGVTG